MSRRPPRTLLAALLALCLWALASTAAHADAGVTVYGDVEGVGFRDRAVWVVAASSVEAFYEGELIASQRLDAEGPYELQITPTPPGLLVWVLEDRDADGPEPEDPHFVHSLTPERPTSGDRLEIELSAALPMFVDGEDPGSWLRFQLDARAGATGVTASLLLASFLWVLAWWRARALPRIDTAGQQLPPSRTPRSTGLALAAIVALGLGLRITLALIPGTANLDLSELPYFLMAHGDGPLVHKLGGILDPLTLLSRHWPLLPLSFAGLDSIVGGAPSSWRLIPLACAAGALLTTYSLTRRLAGPEAGLLASLVLACSPLAAHFGASLSPHGPHLLGVSLSALVLTRAVLGRERRWVYLWVLVSVLGFYLHILHVAFFAGELFFLLLLLLWPRSSDTDRVVAARLVRGAALVVAATLPVATALMMGARRIDHGQGLMVRLFSFQSILPGGTLGETGRMLAGLPAELVWLTPLAAAVVLLGLWRLIRRLPLAAALLGVPAGSFLLVYLVAHWVFAAEAGHANWHTAHFTTGVLALLAPLQGIGTVLLLRWAHRSFVGGGPGRALAIGAGLLAVAPIGLSLHTTAALFDDPGRPDTKGAVAIVQSQAQDGDALVVTPGLPHHDLVQYEVLGGRSPGTVPVYQLTEGQAGKTRWMGTVQESLQVPLERALQRFHTERIWVFAYRETRFGRPKLDHDRISGWRQAWLQQHFEEIERWPLASLDLVLMQRERPRLTLAPGQPIVLDDSTSVFRYSLPTLYWANVPSISDLPAGSMLSEHGSRDAEQSATPTVWGRLLGERGADLAPMSPGLRLELPLDAPVEGALVVDLQIDPPVEATCIHATIDSCDLLALDAPSGRWRGASGEACRLEGAPRLRLLPTTCGERVTVRGLTLEIQDTPSP